MGGLTIVAAGAQVVVGVQAVHTCRLRSHKRPVAPTSCGLMHSPPHLLAAASCAGWSHRSVALPHLLCTCHTDDYSWGVPLPPHPLPQVSNDIIRRALSFMSPSVLTSLLAGLSAPLSARLRPTLPPCIAAPLAPFTETHQRSPPPPIPHPPHRTTTQRPALPLHAPSPTPSPALLPRPQA